MYRKLFALCLLPLFTSLCFAQGPQTPSSPSKGIPSWTASNVQHVYGLPDTKPKAKGSLAVDDAGLTFRTNRSHYTIPWSSVLAADDGSESVELFGTTGTIVRMMIPDGGGLVAAGVMHHKVYDLTVDFEDAEGAYHAAVFELPSGDATRVLHSYTQIEPAAKNDPLAGSIPAAPHTCNASANAGSGILVAEPKWGEADVPAAYRALVYEHVVHRLQGMRNVGPVYRAGARNPLTACPEYTVALSIIRFKPGSQVKRATLGPIGFFVGTTQMVFRVHITDASGKMNLVKEFKVTVRGESHSAKVADDVARKLAKYSASSIQQYQESERVGKISA